MSSALRPVGLLRQDGDVVLQLGTGFLAAWLALSQVQGLARWLPVREAREAFVVVFSVILAAVSAVPAFKDRRRFRSLQAQLRSTYAATIVQSLDKKLDSLVTTLRKEFPLGTLTASIMVPHGSEILPVARRLRIIAASQKLRHLPSMALTLDWDEGLAGRIWKEGAGTAPLAVTNDPAGFAKLGINPIDERKRRTGTFGHLSGICLPINYQNPGRARVQILGVLSIGSDRAEDVEVFRSRELVTRVYHLVATQVVPDLRMFCLTGGGQELPAG